MRNGANFYDEIGGHDTLAAIVHGFYERVALDPLLRPMYEGDDLGPAERRLRLFLEQYWGGPRTYSEERGHPRLRMRHIPFKVDPAARDAWLSAMYAAIADIPPTVLDDQHRATMLTYMERAATTLVNHD